MATGENVPNKIDTPAKATIETIPMATPFQSTPVLNSCIALAVTHNAPANITMVAAPAKIFLGSILEKLSNIPPFPPLAFGDGVSSASLATFAAVNFPINHLIAPPILCVHDMIPLTTFVPTKAVAIRPTVHNIPFKCSLANFNADTKASPTAVITGSNLTCRSVTPLIKFCIILSRLLSRSICSCVLLFSFS
jgi:hypothetical protein